MPVVPLRKTWDPDQNLTTQERLSDESYTKIRDMALGVAASAKYVATWADLDNPTFDACDTIVRCMRDIGGANHQHLRGYQPPADLTIIDACDKSIDLLTGGQVFQRMVPGLVEAKRIMLTGLHAIGQAACVRLAAHGEKPPRHAMDKYNGSA